MSLFHAGLTPALDADGAPISGATWTFYAAGTSTPISVYSDYRFTTSLGSTVTANAAGRFPPIFYNEASPTRAVLKDAAGATITRADIDPINAGFSFTAANRTILSIIPAQEGELAFLAEAGREGQFIRRIGTAPTDLLQGIYVEHALSGYWERLWDETHGRPEWFGCRRNDPSPAVANLLAVQACVAMCPVTLLTSGTYYFSDTFKIATPYRTVRGEAKPDGYLQASGVRVVCTDESKNIIQVGPDLQPGNLNDFYRNITLENVCARYVEAPTVPSSGNEANAVRPFTVQYTIGATLRNCAAWEPIIGFFFKATIKTRVIECEVFRSDAFGGANDFFRAFWARGIPAILAGGNASLFLTDCNVSIGNAPALVSPTGLWVDGDFSDLFVDGLETSQVPYPIHIDGSAGVNAAGKIDVHLRDFVFDQVAGDGIDIQGLNALANITIRGGYIQINDGGANNKAIWLRGGAGTVTVDETQIYGVDSSTTSTGIYVNNQPNVTIGETVKINNIAFGISLDGTSPNCDINARINGQMAGDGTKAAVNVTAGTRVRLAPKITGKALGWAQGIKLIGTAHSRVVIDPSLIDAGAISGGVKVLLNATSPTTAGYHEPDGTVGAESDLGICIQGFAG